MFKYLCEQYLRCAQTIPMNMQVSTECIVLVRMIDEIKIRSYLLPLACFDKTRYYVRTKSLCIRARCACYILTSASVNTAQRQQPNAIRKYPEDHHLIPCAASEIAAVICNNLKKRGHCGVSHGSAASYA